MARRQTNTDEDTFALSAASLTQLLAAVASFLGAYVLPAQFPELMGTSRTILLVLGSILLCLGVANIFLGRQLSRLLARAGRRSRVVIPREGIGYLAIMLTLACGAMLGQRNTPLLLFGMMAGPFILNGWLVYMMLKGIEVRRSVEKRAQAGELYPVEIAVHNRKRWFSSHLVEVRDQIRSVVSAEPNFETEASVIFQRVPARQTRVGRYHLRFPARGRYQLGPARISSRYPLGIGERGLILSDTCDVLVHPRIGRLAPVWKRRQKELAESTQRSLQRAGIFDDEFHRIREYRPDDNVRSIHWRSTARCGQLMVREFHQNRRTNIFVLLDLYESDQQTESDAELAISLAATLCDEQTRAASGDCYLLAIAAAETTVISSRSPGAFRQDALDALAVCRRSADADLQALLQALVEHRGITDERFLLITPRADVAAEALMQAGRQSSLDYLDFAQRTTVIDATGSTLQEILICDDGIIGHGSTTHALRSKGVSR